jgi:hypothetical protein
VSTARWLGGRAAGEGRQREIPGEGRASMPSKSANVKNPKQYEALKDKGMSKERAAKKG